MNLLELVNAAERESNTVSQSQRLTTVVGASGRQEKIVQWVIQAWQDIQNERRDWTFLRSQFSAPLTIDQAGYTAAELNITDFSSWGRDLMNETPFSIYDTTIGRGDETPLKLIPYRDWLRMFDIGAPDSMRPLYVAIGYDNKLYFGNPPDKAYTARGWCRKAIQTLAADTDEPVITEDYHMAIVWRALMLLQQSDEAPDAYAAALANYRPYFNRMIREFLPVAEVT